MAMTIQCLTVLCSGKICKYFDCNHTPQMHSDYNFSHAILYSRYLWDCVTYSHVSNLYYSQGLGLKSFILGFHSALALHHHTSVGFKEHLVLQENALLCPLLIPHSSNHFDDMIVGVLNTGVWHDRVMTLQSWARPTTEVLPVHIQYVPQSQLANIESIPSPYMDWSIYESCRLTPK